MRLARQSKQPSQRKFTWSSELLVEPQSSAYYNDYNQHHYRRAAELLEALPSFLQSC